MFWDVAIRDDGKCVYCGLDGSLDVRILSTLQLDHLIPRTSMGSSDLDNLVLSCTRCNGDKANFNPAEGIVDTPAVTDALRNQLIEKARKYVASRRSRYYADLFDAINSK